MSELVITGVGISTPTGTNSEAALAHHFPDITAAGEPGPSEPGRDRKVLPHIRYKDPIVLPGIFAAQGALAAAGLSGEVIRTDPFRHGILLAASRGPAATRASLFQSGESRGGKSVSATFFSSCGYNIAGSLVAAATGIVGPVLTLAPSGDALAALARQALRFLRAGRTRAMMIGFTEAEGAVMLVLEPAAMLADRASTRRIPLRSAGASGAVPEGGGREALWQGARQWYEKGRGDEPVLVAGRLD